MGLLYHMSSRNQNPECLVSEDKMTPEDFPCSVSLHKSTYRLPLPGPFCVSFKASSFLLQELFFPQGSTLFFIYVFTPSSLRTSLYPLQGLTLSRPCLTYSSSPRKSLSPPVRYSALLSSTQSPPEYYWSVVGSSLLPAGP